MPENEPKNEQIELEKPIAYTPFVQHQSLSSLWPDQDSEFSYDAHQATGSYIPPCAKTPLSEITLKTTHLRML